MNAISCILIGYLVGTLNPAYILGKVKGFDIRKHGSGNAGASNALILMGKLTGVACALLDIIKAYTVYRLAGAMFPMCDFAGGLAGAACILGHIFPIWMHFDGGKGLACLGGVILAFSWKFFLLILGLEIVIALVVDYICVVAMSAAVAFPVVYWLRTREWMGTAMFLVVAMVMVGKHAENIRRIREGKEVRLSFLWRKDKELERLRESYAEDDGEAAELLRRAETQ